MKFGTVCTCKSTQAVQLPSDARFPEGVKRVAVHKVGASIILTPLKHAWTDFFLSESSIGGSPEDFLPERASQNQKDREPL